MWRLGLSSELDWPSTKQEWAELVLAAGGQGNSLLHLASWARSQSEQWEHSNLTWWFLWQMWRLLHNAAIKPDPTLRPYSLCPDTSVFNLYPVWVSSGSRHPHCRTAAPRTARPVSKYTQWSSPMVTSLFGDKNKVDTTNRCEALKEVMSFKYIFTKHLHTKDSKYFKYSKIFHRKHI